MANTSYRHSIDHLVALPLAVAVRDAPARVVGMRRENPHFMAPSTQASGEARCVGSYACGFWRVVDPHHCHSKAGLQHWPHPAHIWVIAHTIADVSRSVRNLAGFTGAGYTVGRGKLVQALWLLTSGAVFTRWWCPSRLRVGILRLFGAQIGKGVLVRHRVRVHWPWKLTVGDHSWIGEGAWLLNLEPIVIGANVCVSQDVLLCTGSHNRHSDTFEFDNGPITVGDGAWIAARAVVLRDVKIGERATVGAAVVVSRDVPRCAVVHPLGTFNS